MNSKWNRTPGNDLAAVKALANDRKTLRIEQAALADALGWGLDVDDIVDVINSLSLDDFWNTAPTKYKYPKTISDYYKPYVPDCCSRMFVKFLISNGVLVITSFKGDDSHGI